MFVFIGLLTVCYIGLSHFFAASWRQLTACKLPFLSRCNYGYLSLGLKAFAQSAAPCYPRKSAKVLYNQNKYELSKFPGG